jgi:NAD(P)-dependent dehydrogenase (short-subunit alcohol dehydrogenase family)
MRAKRPHPESVAGTASRRDHDRCSAGQPEFAEWARLLSNDGAAIPCWGYLPRVRDGAVFRPTSWVVQPEELWSVACADCSRSPDADSAVKAAVERFEGIDVLVNNAASFYAGFFEELTPEQIERQFAVSVIGR